ncbi:MAG: phytochelatin synthase family protein [Cyanobacteria bacterium P01_G01_bin.19]
MKLLRKILRYVGIGLLFCLTTLLIVVINFAFATPKIDRETLPPNLISLESQIGQEMLAESKYRNDYFNLQPNFVSQSRRAFCGVASSVIAVNILNEADVPVTQATIFDRDTRQVIHPLKVTFGGMTLAQLSDILRANHLSSQEIYASESNLDEFRTLALDNLNNDRDLILINYHRKALNQNGSGHISPIAAYHQESDRFLIMDVAAYRYPPVWVKSTQLWQSMDSIDSVSDRTRGFILVQSK